MNPQDDYNHPIGPESNFNESMYFHFHDTSTALAGFLRLANRPREGYGERTVCLYLPDGSVAFGFARPEITHNDSFDAADLTFTVVEPLEHLTVHFEGELFRLEDPQALLDPNTAWATSPKISARITLDHRAAAPAVAHTFEGDGEPFAPNHYEQNMRVTGRVELSDETWDVDGYGLRDHSWGPRSWQAPWFYRWLHGTSESMSFMAAYFGNPDGGSLQGGFVWDGSQLHTCDRVEISTDRDESGYQRAVRVEVKSGERAWQFVGNVEATVPLRHRRRDADGAHDATRIVEGKTIWESSDGGRLYGMTEYLDQLEDGKPVGQHV